MEIPLPPDQEARLAALAASAGRSPGEVVQEALALWQSHQMQRQQVKHTPAEAAARIRELCQGNVLPRARRSRTSLITVVRDVRSRQFRRHAMVFRKRGAFLCRFHSATAGSR
jgi:MoxR-like ATPase